MIIVHWREPSREKEQILYGSYLRHEDSNEDELLLLNQTTDPSIFEYSILHILAWRWEFI